MTISLAFFLAPDNGVSPVHAANASDDYVKFIEAEGNRLEFLGQAKKEQEMLLRNVPTPAKASPISKAATPKHAVKAPPAPPSASVTQQEFEKSLRESLPGSYKLYTLFEAHEKESVFREYENAKTEGTIRFLPAVTKILSLTSRARQGN